MKRSVKLGVFTLVLFLVAGAMVALSARSTKAVASSPVNGPSHHQAPSQLIFNKSLKSSSVSWDDCCATATPGFFNIDSPLNFTCPGPTTCTASAEMWVQVGGNTFTANRLAVCGLVDGNYMAEPVCPYAGEALADGDYSVISMSQSMDNIAPGKHTLQTQLYSDDGVTLAQYSIIYRLYKP